MKFTTMCPIHCHTFFSTDFSKEDYKSARFCQSALEYINTSTNNYARTIIVTSSIRRSTIYEFLIDQYGSLGDNKVNTAHINHGNIAILIDKDSKTDQCYLSSKGKWDKNTVKVIDKAKKSYHISFKSNESLELIERLKVEESFTNMKDLKSDCEICSFVLSRPTFSIPEKYEINNRISEILKEIYVEETAKQQRKLNEFYNTLDSYCLDIDNILKELENKSIITAIDKIDRIYSRTWEFYPVIDNTDMPTKTNYSITLYVEFSSRGNYIDRIYTSSACCPCERYIYYNSHSSVITIQDLDKEKIISKLSKMLNKEIELTKYYDEVVKFSRDDLNN